MKISYKKMSYHLKNFKKFVNSKTEICFKCKKMSYKKIIKMMKNKNDNNIKKLIDELKNLK